MLGARQNRVKIASKSRQNRVKIASKSRQNRVKLLLSCKNAIDVLFHPAAGGILVQSLRAATGCEFDLV
jgi:hypothetical protein